MHLGYRSTFEKLKNTRPAARVFVMLLLSLATPACLDHSILVTFEVRHAVEFVATFTFTFGFGFGFVKWS